MIVLAWLFVLTRIVHAAIHIGPNKVRWRSPAFALGFADRRHHVDQALPARGDGRVGLSHAAGRPHQGRRRGARGRPGPAPAGGARRWPTGARATASPARATAPPSATSSTTPCAASGRSPRRWAPTPPAPSALGRRAARARPVDRRRDRQRRRLAARARAAERGRAGWRCRARCPHDAPASVRGDFPDWLEPSFARAFGGAAAEEGAALARRAPVDLRVNTLKADREKVLKALARFARRADAAVAGRRPPAGARRAGPAAQRRGRDRARPGLVRGAGRGLADRRADGRRRRRASRCSIFVQAPAARRWPSPPLMRNTGQIYAYDDDAVRLRPIFERLKRAGVRNAQVLQRGRRARRSTALGPRFDLVFVDAPCTGTRRLAAAARRQVAAASPPISPSARSEQRALLDRRRALVEARRPARLRHLLGAAGGERRPGRRVPGAPSGVRDVALARGVGRAASAASRPPRPTAATTRCSSRRRGTAPTASSSPCCADGRRMSVWPASVLAREPCSEGDLVHR